MSESNYTRTLEQAIIDVNLEDRYMTETKDTRKVVIPESLLYRLINELKLAQEDTFIKETDILIKEAEKYLYDEF